MMNEFVSTQNIVKEMNRQILGGAKTPHSCSFPVLRKNGDKYVIAIFTQFVTKEQVSKQVMQRPAYWCCADICDGSDFVEYNCKEKDFCMAPYDRLYKKGVAAKVGSVDDVSGLYAQMDSIRKKYIESEILDAFSYNQYLEELFKVIPNGQINFYKELSKMI